MTTPVESDAQGLTAGHSAVTGGSAPPVNLTRSIRQPLGAVWQALISPEGAGVWLGEGAVLGTKGESYHCADGTSGVVRSYHPLEQLRVSWHADQDAPPTIVEVDLDGGVEGTTVHLRHDGIIDGAQRVEMERRWAERLDALAGYAGERTG